MLSKTDGHDYVAVLSAFISTLILVACTTKHYKVCLYLHCYMVADTVLFHQGMSISPVLLKVAVYANSCII